MAWYPTVEGMAQSLELAAKISYAESQILEYCKRNPYQAISNTTAFITETTLNGCIFDSFSALLKGAANGVTSLVTSLAEGLPAALNAQQAQAAIAGNLLSMVILEDFKRKNYI
jgi:high-affinity K+ transport system ATPase subunit B